MNLKTTERLAKWLGATALLAIATACSPAADGPPAEEKGREAAAPSPAQSSSGGMPPIYVSSRIENLRDGENPWRANYRQMLDVCHEAGHPISELSPEEVELLGLTRIERWFGADTYAIRVETWGYGTPGQMPDQICQFQIGSKGHHTYFDRSQFVSIDLETGKRSTGATNREVFERQKLDENEGRRQEEVEAARNRPGGIRTQQVAGQNCDLARVDHAEVCTWSGGREWGFRTLMPTLVQTDHSTSLRNRIILEQRSDVPGFPHVTTEAFVIGAPLDQGAMQPRR